MQCMYMQMYKQAYKLVHSAHIAREYAIMFMYLRISAYIADNTPTQTSTCTCVRLLCLYTRICMHIHAYTTSV